MTQADLSPETVSLQGRRLRTVAAAGAGGEIGPETRFECSEDGEVVAACYQGGAVRLGFRLGTRSGNHLQLRFLHVDQAGEVTAGRADARLELLPDGRVRLHELWAPEGR
ncbi:MAG TPA: hypothetical protein VKG45_12095, partial [Actinomycetes bacterium]|nr:hypothetical protein [Actinomycetes bacterium]